MLKLHISSSAKIFLTHVLAVMPKVAQCVQEKGTVCSRYKSAAIMACKLVLQELHTSGQMLPGMHTVANKHNSILFISAKLLTKNSQTDMDPTNHNT